MKYIITESQLKDLVRNFFVSMGVSVNVEPITFWYNLPDDFKSKFSKASFRLYVKEHGPYYYISIKDPELALEQDAMSHYIAFPTGGGWRILDTQDNIVKGDKFAFETGLSGLGITFEDFMETYVDIVGPKDGVV